MVIRSYTSLFKTNTFAALLALVVIFPAAWAYTLYINPEILFWHRAFDVKAAFSRQLNATSESKIVFTGGSSCAFQVDVTTLTFEDKIPSVNAGLHAGMGAVPIISFSSSFLKKGDTLVLMIEPGLLSSTTDMFPPLGKQALLAFGDSKIPFSPIFSQSEYNLSSLILSGRPGLYNISTMLGKMVLQRRPYRYTEDDLHEGGFLSTPERSSPAPLFAPSELSLSRNGELLLTELKTWAEKNGISVYYLMPLCLVAPSSTEQYKALNTAFLNEVARFIPVIPDPALGISINPRDFADTPQHMTQEAAESRTSTIAALLREYVLNLPR